jgi:hypothetical protein
MTVDKLTVDKMTVDKRTVHKMAVGWAFEQKSLHDSEIDLKGPKFSASLFALKH